MDQNPSVKKQIPRERSAMLVAIIILLLLTIFLGYKYLMSRQNIQEARSAAKAECQDQGNLNFALLFIDKVLQAEKEVDFDTRLELENSVRALDDKEILVQWQKFTSAANEGDAQKEVKNLLRLIIEKARS